MPAKTFCVATSTLIRAARKSLLPTPGSNLAINPRSLTTMSKLTPDSTIALSNGVSMPRLGFGVYLSPPAQTVASCKAALSNGYRHIDTAQFYGNEAQVGEAVRADAQKESVFVTTKILKARGSVEKNYDACVASVDALRKAGDGGSVDCFLIHSPNAGERARKELWLALEKVYEGGKARSIGVSNYGIGDIEEMKEFAKVWPPHVIQLELHPWCQQKEIVAYATKHNIAVQAYCPLVRQEKAQDPTLLAVAKKYDVSPNQVLVRWSLQRGWVPLPKSDNPGRIKENGDVFGFEIDAEDMKRLDGLDQGAKGAIVQAAKNN